MSGIRSPEEAPVILQQESWRWVHPVGASGSARKMLETARGVREYVRAIAAGRAEDDDPPQWWQDLIADGPQENGKPWPTWNGPLWRAHQTKAMWNCARTWMWEAFALAREDRRVRRELSAQERVLPEPQQLDLVTP